MAANESTERPLEGLTGRPIGYDDATWILTSAFIVFTMQSGFGLIESGMYATTVLRTTNRENRRCHYQISTTVKSGLFLESLCNFSALESSVCVYTPMIQ